MSKTSICLGLASLIIGAVGTAISVRTAPVDPLGGDRLINVNPIEENENSTPGPNGFHRDDSEKQDFEKQEFEKEEFNKDGMGVGTL